MAEYIELNELQKFCRKYTEVDAVSLILADRTDLLHPADVVERAEYERLRKEYKHYFRLFEQDNDLRSKIDKAIEDADRIRTDVLLANSYYKPNEVLDIVDQITKLFEEI